MSENKVRQLEPQNVWNYFEDLNAVPRPSKNEEKVINFMKAFAQGLNLPYEVDRVGNVIIRKPATQGMEDRRPVVLQSHLDMVHQKNSDTEFDFSTQGIQSYIDGEWVKARGTTLGADNGMGVAAIMAVLASKNVAHPDLEALFTIDEESGMTGAHNLQGDKLQGEILMNLDTEDDDELSIGCAGGIDININWDYKNVNLSGDYTGLEIKLSGLSGGHSGMDIIYGRANANKVMNRLLYGGIEEFGMRIASIDGGSLRNAIPRESVAIVAVPDKYLDDFKEFLDVKTSEIRNEYSISDPKLKLTYSEIKFPEVVMDKDDQIKLLQAIQASHDGIGRLSSNVKELVETSNSLARIIVRKGEFTMQSLTRSDSESAKEDMAERVAAPFKMIGAKVEFSGSYPGWKLSPQAPMLQMMKNLYIEMYNEEPRVIACHAGLECGLLGQHYPDMEMISFGPTIRHPHSPDEKVNIASVQKFWDYLIKALERIPKRKMA